MNKNSYKKFQDTAKNIRLLVLNMISKSRSSHIGSCFSAAEILTTLYFKIMRLNLKNPRDPKRDRFILSKGHAAALLYATLAERGFFKKEVLGTFYANGSHLPGHVSIDCVPGVEATTGSLGHGLSIAAGMAFAGKGARENFRVFALLSDGECDEGSTWEAALFSGHHKLDNLMAIIDYNKWQSFGRTREVLNLEPFLEKWKDFGWSAKEVDGHNFQEIFNALKRIPFQKNKPSVLIAHTIKAKGLSFMEDKLESHYRPPTEEEYKIAVKELSNL